MEKHQKQPKRGFGRNNPGAPVEKAKDFKGTILKLIKYLSKYHIAIIAVIIFAAGSTVFNVIGPKVLGMATTEIFNGVVNKYNGTGGIDLAKIGHILAMLMVLYGISWLLSLLQGIIMTGVAQKTAYGLRKEISEKINRLPMNFYDKTTYGNILSIVTNDVDTLGTNINQTITQLVTSVSTIIGVLIMMLSISPIMTVVVLVLLPISVAVIKLVVSHSQKYFKAQQNYLGEVNGQVEEYFGGHNVVKLFNKEDDVIEEFKKNNDILYASAWKSQFISGLMQPLMGFIGNIGYAAVAVIGAFLSIKKVIEVGDIQSFIQYVRQFTQPINQMAQVSNLLQSMAAAAERVFKFLEETEEDQKAEHHAVITEINDEGKEITRNVTPDDITGQVDFEHIKFGYNSDRIIIKDFSAHVKAGQKIAIVGPTGAGKTTLIKLLMRFYDVNSGSIKLDGHNIKDFDRSELREAFGMVLQDTWLFKGSIMENIRYGRLDATDEEVIEAAKAAHIHYYIKTLPGGYNMELNEEASNISQGQKQLLTIARAILADNKILILDEATSSVDTRTEVLIQKAMDNLMEGRTSFIIAHRLSTIKNADIILVLKDGDIIEQGNHDELMAQNGFYASLYNSQFDESETA